MAVVAVAGCLDALAPERAPRAVTVGLVPLFGASGASSDIPPDVDSIVITIHNPPAPDTTISRRIEPGEDSIVITIDVAITGSNVDTVTMSMEAIRSGPPPEVLYRADSLPLTVRVGQPVRADTIRAEYVGPGAGILQSITLSPRTPVLRPGDSLAFSFTAMDSAGASCCATMPLIWNSRNEGVARVTPRGMVSARSNGTAWIVATSGASAAIKDSVNVVVATGPVAMISFSPATVAFTANAGQANPAPQTVNVTNAGAGTLSGLTLTGIQYASGQPTGWLTATLGAATAPTTVPLSATTGTLAPGTYTASVSLSSSQASNSPLALPVTFVVSPVPTIGFTPSAVAVVDTLTTADPASLTVTITNIGTGTLSGLAIGAVTYGASQPTGWLTASLGGTTAPSTLTLSFAKGLLPVGVYTATVPITSPVAVNSPAGLSVAFDVRPYPLTALRVTPGFGVVVPAGTLTLSSTGFNSLGEPVPAPGLWYLSRSPGVATVDSATGVVTGVADGTAVIIATAPGASGVVLDSTLVVVAPIGVAVAAPVAGGRAFGIAKVGDTVLVRVLVDLTAVPAEKLGSYNARLTWTSGVLRYVGNAVVSGGFTAPTVNSDSAATGLLRFGAADAAGKAGPSIGLVDVRLVADAAGSSPLSFTLTDLTAAITFTQMLSTARVLSTSVSVQ